MPTNLSKRWVKTDGSAVSSAFLSTSPVSLPFDSQNAPQAIENPGYEYALSLPLNKRACTVISGSTDDLSSPQSSSLPSSKTPKRDKAQAQKVQRSAGGRAQRAQDKQHLGTQAVYNSLLDSLLQAPYLHMLKNLYSTRLHYHTLMEHVIEMGMGFLSYIGASVCRPPASRVTVVTDQRQTMKCMPFHTLHTLPSRQAKLENSLRLFFVFLRSNATHCMCVK
jgi:hypothetical protein